MDSRKLGKCFFEQPGVNAPGKPNKIICEEAVSLDADLIVLGKSSKGKISKFLLGSTAAYIVNHASVPVLVVP